MKLTKKEVLHVAKLAKLSLSPSKISTFEKQLSDVVNYVSELGEVDTKDVEPTSQTTGLTNVFREDGEGGESISSEKALSGTEKIHNNYFVVPQVITKEK